MVGTYNSLKYKIDTNNINFDFNVEDYYIYGDKQLIIVLLSNIIDNSINVSDKFGNIVVHGLNDYESRKYILKIKDYGNGIDKDDLDKILEPFYMVDKARTRKNNGIGLGLSICKEICESHNINLNINSRIGEGTEVTLKFDREIIKDKK